MNTFLIAMIRHQLAMLDAYLTALDRSGWGEAQANETLKSWT